MALPAETVQVAYQAGAGSQSASFTGTRLLNVFDAAAGARLPNDSNNAKLRVSVWSLPRTATRLPSAGVSSILGSGAAPFLLAYAPGPAQA